MPPLYTVDPGQRHEQGKGPRNGNDEPEIMTSCHHDIMLNLNLNANPDLNRDPKKQKGFTQRPNYM